MPTDRDYILAIDLGTSGPKVALFTTQGETVGHEFEPTKLTLLPGGGAEQSPDDWWRAIKSATHRLLDRKLAPVECIVALGCTAIWSSTVAVDRAGCSLMNCIMWMDTRGAPHVKQITGGLIEIERYGIQKLLTWLPLTGGIPTHSGKDPIAHILYIKHELADIYEQTHKFLEPCDYLALRLTGQLAASYNSITLHWVTDNRDISKVAYHDGLIRMAGLDREKLPDLRPPGTVLGTLTPEAAVELGLTEKVQVVMGIPDMHSAAIGSGAVRDYEANLGLSTSSWLTCHVPYKRTDLSHNMASLPSAIPGRYLLSNEQECAGMCLNFLRDNVFFTNDALDSNDPPSNVYQQFDRLAESAPPGSHSVVFTPWLYGERTPVEDHLVRGAFFNVSLKTARADLVRAVFEGVAYNSRWLLKYVEQFIGRRLETIHMIGGGSNSNIWCQVHADVLNRPVRQVKDPILANARGAAFVAAAALGYMEFTDIPGRIEIARTYAPTPEHRPIYDELFAEFINLYKRNRPIYARLNR